ncbi:MAG: hypothetical protein IKF78_09975 [Atopobiaceae bacterium]|nr:hypothetical protein [Atopobiaceae bacterium]
MFDTDVHGTVLDTIGRDLRATADYLLIDRKDGDEARRRKLKLHVTAARDMLNDMLRGMEEAK